MSTITATQTSVHGIDALRLDGDGVSVTVTTSMGPRILGLAGPDGRNLLAELPAATIELPGLPVYRMLGGHRLWHTPEVPASTYRPGRGTGGRGRAAGWGRPAGRERPDPGGPEAAAWCGWAPAARSAWSTRCATPGRRRSPRPPGRSPRCRRAARPGSRSAAARSMARTCPTARSCCGPTPRSPTSGCRWRMTWPWSGAWPGRGVASRSARSAGAAGSRGATAARSWSSRRPRSPARTGTWARAPSATPAATSWSSRRSPRRCRSPRRGGRPSPGLAHRAGGSRAADRATVIASLGLAAG